MSQLHPRHLSRRFFLSRALAALAGGAVLGRARPVVAAEDPTGIDNYLGEIRMWSANFAPRFWAFCNGQVLPINQNTALFSLLGTTYGGNGVTTFGLPNLQGRVAIGSGQGNGLAPYSMGQVGGEVSHTLLLNEIPSHTHSLRASSLAGTFDNPAGHVLARNPAQSPAYGPTDNADMLGGLLTPTGGSQAHENRQPYTVINWIIALTGIYPN